MVVPHVLAARVCPAQRTIVQLALTTSLKLPHVVVVGSIFGGSGGEGGGGEGDGGGGGGEGGVGGFGLEIRGIGGGLVGLTRLMRRSIIFLRWPDCVTAAARTSDPVAGKAATGAATVPDPTRRYPNEMAVALLYVTSAAFES